jgi:hypothetical protein
MASSKIEIYNPAGALVYTLTDEALDINIKEILTSGIGSFNFTLPAKKGVEYVYTDILGNWKVKLYLAQTYQVTPDLLCVGKIKKITGPMSTSEGYIRAFEGKNQGEILERRFKLNKCWLNTDVDDIIAEVASDLSLGSDIAVDTSHVDITVRTETYFDLLKKASDYWVSAGTQVKKDFYVDTSDALVWKARPIRTSGVEVLTIGTNILEYTVIRDYLSIRNNITVYGIANGRYPADGDSWTEGSATGWTEVVGTFDYANAANKVGTYCISVIGMGGSFAANGYYPHSRLTVRDVNAINFWHNNQAGPSVHGKIRLHAPDTSNYFESTDVNGIGSTNTWTFNSLALGSASEYDASLNPNGIWTKTGTPNWWDIQGFEFYWETTMGGNVKIDGVYYSPIRSYYTAADATSIAAYGQADAEFTDENLLSATACESRAKTLLYQLKDPVIRADVTVKGTANLLIGDRVSLTIPAEGLSAVNFDVVAVEHCLNQNGWNTKASMVNSDSTRYLPPGTPWEATARKLSSLQDVTREVYSRVVR